MMDEASDVLSHHTWKLTLHSACACCCQHPLPPMPAHLGLTFTRSSMRKGQLCRCCPCATCPCHPHTLWQACTSWRYHEAHLSCSAGLPEPSELHCQSRSVGWATASPFPQGQRSGGPSKISPSGYSPPHLRPVPVLSPAEGRSRRCCQK